MLAGAVAALALALAGPAFGHTWSADTTATLDHSPASAGSAGYCTDATGVTVVVDLSALGGDVVVRCDPGPVGSGVTGIDALQDAGFTVSGTQRYGLAFVCRVQGRPAADEALPIPGDPTYHEQCVDTPPQTAFWAYWYAPDGGNWTYSSEGANTHQPISGGFEGWAFSLGRSDGSAAQPGVDPTRPGQTQPPPPTTTVPTTAPATTSPPRRHHTSHPPATSQPPSTSPATHPPLTTAAPATTASPLTAGPTLKGPPPQPRATTHKHRPRRGHRAHPPGVAWSGGTGSGTAATDAGARVSGTLPDSPDSPSGSSRATLVGLGIVVLLGLGAGLTAWRRSHRP